MEIKRDLAVTFTSKRFACDLRSPTLPTDRPPTRL